VLQRPARRANTVLDAILATPYAVLSTWGVAQTASVCLVPGQHMQRRRAGERVGLAAALLRQREQRVVRRPLVPSGACISGLLVNAL